MTPYQHLILLAASAVPVLPRHGIIPFGVYRSLVIRGLLVRERDGFEITPQGREALAREAVIHG